MSTLRALIVDDEPLARRRLKTLLRDEPGVEVVGECEDGPAALAAVKQHTPDVMFLDVQMPGMDGFDVIEALGPSRCPAVIFVTAYEQHALKAFDVHAVDYLLKPFDRRRLRTAVARARAMTAGDRDVGRRLLALLADVHASRRDDRIVVKARGRVYFVRVDEIDWIEAADHYLTLHAGGDAHLIRGTIKEMEERLDRRRFLRVHRSTIVNLDRVKELLPAFHGEYTIVLHDGSRVSSSRSYADRLRAVLDGPAS